MTTKWRPEGWKNPYYSHSNGDALMSMSEALYEPDKHKAFEAGADAMLEALKVRSGSRPMLRATERVDISYDPLTRRHVHIGERVIGDGKWVFIPDD